MDFCDFGDLNDLQGDLFTVQEGIRAGGDGVLELFNSLEALALAMKVATGTLVSPDLNARPLHDLLHDIDGATELYEASQRFR